MNTHLKQEDQPMRQEDMIIEPHSFSLGPFEVRCLPYFHGIYSLYILSANGVPIRRQISYPELADGWIGLAFTITDHDKILSVEEKELLLGFKARLGSSRELMKVQTGSGGSYIAWRRRK